MMNKDSEQLNYDMSVIEAPDEPLSRTDIYKALQNWLDSDRLSRVTLCGKKVTVYETPDARIVLLCKAVTYLGNPHPAFKKRIQIPSSYLRFCDELDRACPGYDVRFIGVYHFRGNIIFVDFSKHTYLRRRLHNSSAHVYVNDLYQGMIYGVFSKLDKSGNTITTIRNDRFKEYLEAREIDNNATLFRLFSKFNSGFPFGQWLYALNAIKEMHSNDWTHWRQTEWAGWFLEYRFEDFIKKNHIEDKMLYTGTSNKKEGMPDFDIRFIEEDFYGDLKASGKSNTDVPGNDQKSLIDCIYRYHRFWYVIYEHETKKDAPPDYTATRERNRYIKSVDASYNKGELSYKSRMKHSVCFDRMTIIELNPVNFREVLRNFNQGHQPDGSPRAPKFKINKKVLNNDNYVVFRYVHP